MFGLSVWCYGFGLVDVCGFGLCVVMMSLHVVLMVYYNCRVCCLGLFLSCWLVCVGWLFGWCVGCWLYCLLLCMLLLGCWLGWCVVCCLFGFLLLYLVFLLLHCFVGWFVVFRLLLLVLFGGCLFCGLGFWWLLVGFVVYGLRFCGC